MARAAKMDPLESAKITEERVASDAEKAKPQPAPEPAPPPLLTGGPTIEDWVLDGHPVEDYPPEGYAPTPSGGLVHFTRHGRVPEDMLAVARARRAPPVARERVVYVVLETANVNVGHGQFYTFEKGRVIDQTDYGEDGIRRLESAGLKLEKRAKK